MVNVCVLGTGFGGLAAAIQLRQAGHAATLLERASGVGGAWRDAIYPGCACDVQSHLYSLSFALNPDWTRVYASQGEIRDYLERLTDTRYVVSALGALRDPRLPDLPGRETFAGPAMHSGGHGRGLRPRQPLAAPGLAERLPELVPER